MVFNGTENDKFSHNHNIVNFILTHLVDNHKMHLYYFTRGICLLIFQQKHYGPCMV